jgi:hypothetical protein
MEIISQVPQPIEKPEESMGCLSEVGLFLSGAVLPLGSLAFYRKMSQRGVMKAMLFFLVFTSAITCLFTIGATIAVYSVSGEIQKAYADGTIPEITISKGTAEVKGREPVILLDGKSSQGEKILVAVDTTGVIKQIDRYQYTQGILITKTEMHFLNKGEYQKFPLQELNTYFEKDPLLINAETVTQAWNGMSAIIAVVVLISLWIWHFILRLMIIAMYALVVWGVVALLRPGTKFDPIIITGLYAIVPALYLARLFSRVEFTLPGMQTFFLFVFWTIGLVAALMEHPFFKTERPLRSWTALIGVPMLILFIVDSIKAIPAPYGAPLLWAAFILTFIALAGVRGFFRYQDGQQKPPPETIQTL